MHYLDDDGTINDYNYKPDPIFYGESLRYFGIELEIDEGGKDGNNVLDTHKREGMQLMEELFAPQFNTQVNAYPVILRSGYDVKVCLTAVDFDDVTITADSIEDGIAFIREKISKCISHGFSPLSSPLEQIQLGQDEMVLMVSV